MKRRRRILIVLSLLALAIVIAFSVADNDGPKYKGRSLKEWALIHERATGWESVHNSKYDPDMLRQSEVAILAIGTNALPWLMKWIQVELKPTPWRDKIANAIDKFPGELWDKPPLNAWLADRDWDRFRAAGITFRILGTNASPALSELTRSFHQQKSSELCVQVSHGLACIGEAGLPILLTALEDASCAYRADILLNLYDKDRWGTNSTHIKKLLVKYVGDSDEAVARRAAEMLGSLKIEPEISIPALAKGLIDSRREVRVSSVRSLAWIGKPASNALPELTVALRDSSREVRDWATNAINKIAPEMLAAEPNSSENDKP